MVTVLLEYIKFYTVCGECSIIEYLKAIPIVLTLSAGPIIIVLKFYGEKFLWIFFT